MRSIKTVIAVFALVFGISGCKSADVEYKYPEKVRGRYEMPNKRNEADRENKLFSGNGLRLFSSEKNQETSLGINSFLWRATLETLTFMPLSSADPFGGVILTEWYAPVKNERFKITVLIMSKSLRADGLTVSVFKQTKQKDGSWADAPADATVAKNLENAILTKAQQLYLAHSQE